MSDGSDDDDWFYDSIRRYRTLQMYDLQMHPQRMAQSSDRTLVIVGRHPKLKKTEILEIELPRKLFLTSEEEGLCKGKDFKIVAGGFVDDEIHSLVISSQESIAIASFQNVAGLVVLAHGNDDAVGVFIEERRFLQDSSMISPNISISATPEILVCERNDKPLLKVDPSSGNILETIALSETISSTPGTIIPKYITRDTCAVLHSTSGFINVIDLRTHCVVHQVNQNSNSSKYTLSVEKQNVIGVLSSSGDCSVYDFRVTKLPYAESFLNLSKCNVTDFKLDVNGNDRISISGFDNSVFVYDIKGTEFVGRFVHEGHAKMDVRSIGHVSDHLWLPHIADNFLVSSAVNGTLNCWEFV